MISASRFERDDEAFLIGTGLDISRLKKFENKIRQSLKEKEVLLAEVHHRVKNNLAVISGLMQLQAMQSDNEEVVSTLMDSQSRIKSIATIHELLYESQSFSRVNLSDEISHLIEHISRAGSGNTDVDVALKIDPVELNVNQAIPIALILNELLTNIFKHAFRDRQKGRIELKLKKESSKFIDITLIDDGIGLADDFSLDAPSSNGLKIISVLKDQLMQSSTTAQTKMVQW